MSNKDQKCTPNQLPVIVKNVAMLLEGNKLKKATMELAEEIRAKVRRSQQGVPTFWDNGMLQLIEQLCQLNEALPWEESSKHLKGREGEKIREGLRRLQIFLSRRSQERFVDFPKRAISTPEGTLNAGEIDSYEYFMSQCDLSIYDYCMSQGVVECMQWKGMPLFKTVFDFTIYTMMLWNVKPKTIIELGSGAGASAVWLADLMTTYQIVGHIYSVDLKKLDLEHNAVNFIQGDCRKIQDVFTKDFLRNAPHPWLLIEDAHINVYGILCHFHHYLKKNDYVIIEDSLGKENEIANFLMKYADCYKIDTYYTDFFGRNATCAINSIIVRV